MGTYSVKDPYGVTLNIDIDGDTPSPTEKARIDEYLASRQPQPEAPKPDPSRERGALSAGLGYLGADLRTAIARPLLDLGLTETGMGLEAEAQKIRKDVGETYHPVAGRIEDVKDLSTLAHYAGTQIAQNAPGMALPFATGNAGAYGGGALGFAVAGPPGAAVGATIGGALGWLLGDMPQQYAQDIEAQVEAGVPFEQTSQIRALPAAVAQAYLDRLTFKSLNIIAPFAKTAKRAALTEAEAAAQKTWLGFASRVSKQAASSMMEEAGTETLQQAIEILQADPQRLMNLDASTRSELLNAFAGGAVAGGVLGGVHNAVFGPEKPKDEENPDLRKGQRGAIERAFSEGVSRTLAADQQFEEETANVRKMREDPFYTGNFSQEPPSPPSAPGVPPTAAPMASTTVLEEKAAERPTPAPVDKSFPQPEETPKNVTPTEEPAPRPAIHFIGFHPDKDKSKFDRAVQMFGQPDFVHRKWDARAKQGGEYMPGDIRIFANGSEKDAADPNAYDDSEEDIVAFNKAQKKAQPKAPPAAAEKVTVKKPQNTMPTEAELDAMSDEEFAAWANEEGEPEFPGFIKGELGGEYSNRGEKSAEAKPEVAPEEKPPVEAPITDAGKGTVPEAGQSHFSVEATDSTQLDQDANTPSPHDVVVDGVKKGTYATRGAAEKVAAGVLEKNPSAKVSLRPKNQAYSVVETHRTKSGEVRKRTVRTFRDQSEAINHANAKNTEWSKGNEILSKAEALKVKRTFALTEMLAHAKRLNAPKFALHVERALTGEPGQYAEAEIYTGVVPLLKIAMNIHPHGLTQEQLAERLKSIFDHEFVHILQAAEAFSEREWQAIIKYVKSAQAYDPDGQMVKGETWYERAQGLYAKHDQMSDEEYELLVLKEAMAEAYRSWAKNRRTVTGLPATIFRRITSLIRSVAEYFDKDKEAKRVFQSIYEGKRPTDFKGTDAFLKRAMKPLPSKDNMPAPGQPEDSHLTDPDKAMQDLEKTPGILSQFSNRGLKLKHWVPGPRRLILFNRVVNEPAPIEYLRAKDEAVRTGSDIYDPSIPFPRFNDPDYYERSTVHLALNGSYTFEAITWAKPDQHPYLFQVIDKAGKHVGYIRGVVNARNPEEFYVHFAENTVQKKRRQFERVTEETDTNNIDGFDLEDMTSLLEQLSRLLPEAVTKVRGLRISGAKARNNARGSRGKEQIIDLGRIRRHLARSQKSVRGVNTAVYFGGPKVREQIAEAKDPKSLIRLVMVDPGKFLELASAGLRAPFEAKIYGEKSELGMRLDEMPSLTMSSPADGIMQVLDHEGRHRNYGMRFLGYEKVPLILKFKSMDDKMDSYRKDARFYKEKSGEHVPDITFTEDVDFNAFENAVSPVRVGVGLAPQQEQMGLTTDRSKAGIREGDLLTFEDALGQPFYVGDNNERLERPGDGAGWEARGSSTPLEGAPHVEGCTGPDPELVRVAASYAKAAGIPFRRQARYVEVDEQRARRIADAYEAMPHAPNDPKVKEAYADLIKQTKDQYFALVREGYSFTFFDSNTDPYNGNPWDAMRDLRKNKKMAVYGTYDGYGTDGITGAEIEDNPMLADTGLEWKDQNGVPHPVTANDLFRAVHDAFGHGLEGAGFRARGEENAWQAHARLFHGPAVAAITSETRGQNSWLNFGPHGDNNRNAKLQDTVFAPQKTGLMPEWTWKEGFAESEPTEFTIPYKLRDPVVTDARSFILEMNKPLVEAIEEAGGKAYNIQALGVYMNEPVEVSSGFRGVFPPGTSDEHFHEFAARVFEKARDENQRDAFVSVERGLDYTGPDARPGITVWLNQSTIANPTQAQFGSNLWKVLPSTADILAFIRQKMTIGNLAGYTILNTSHNKLGAASMYQSISMIWIPEYAGVKPEDLDDNLNQVWADFDAIQKLFREENYGSITTNMYSVLLGSSEGPDNYDDKINVLRDIGSRRHSSSGEDGTWRRSVLSSVEARTRFAAAQQQRSGDGPVDGRDVAQASRRGAAESVERKLFGPGGKFYSRLEENVGKVPQEYNQPIEWLRMIDAMPGLSKEEIKNSGIREYLKNWTPPTVNPDDPSLPVTRQQKMVSREQLQTFLQNNRLLIREATWGDDVYNTEPVIPVGGALPPEDELSKEVLKEVRRVEGREARRVFISDVNNIIYDDILNDRFWRSEGDGGGAKGEFMNPRSGLIRRVRYDLSHYKEIPVSELKSSVVRRLIGGKTSGTVNYFTVAFDMPSSDSDAHIKGLDFPAESLHFIRAVHFNPEGNSEIFTGWLMYDPTGARDVPWEVQDLYDMKTDLSDIAYTIQSSMPYLASKAAELHGRRYFTRDLETQIIQWANDHGYPIKGGKKGPVREFFGNAKYRSYSLDGGDMLSYFEKAFYLPKPLDYRPDQSHFAGYLQQPLRQHDITGEVVGHMRGQMLPLEGTRPDGSPLLSVNLDELQSDLHQRARTMGYADEVNMAEISDARESLNQDIKNLDDKADFLTEQLMRAEKLASAGESRDADAFARTAEAHHLEDVYTTLYDEWRGFAVNDPLGIRIQQRLNVIDERLDTQYTIRSEYNDERNLIIRALSHRLRREGKEMPMLFDDQYELLKDHEKRTVDSLRQRMDYRAQRIAVLEKAKRKLRDIQQAHSDRKRDAYMQARDRYEAAQNAFIQSRLGGSAYARRDAQIQQIIRRLSDQRDAAIERAKDIRRRLDRVEARADPVPDIPLRGDAWWQMMIKRALMMAVDMNADFISVTPGQYINDRFKLPIEGIQSYRDPAGGIKWRYKQPDESNWGYWRTSESVNDLAAYVGGAVAKHMWDNSPYRPEDHNDEKLNIDKDEYNKLAEFSSNIKFYGKMAVDYIDKLLKPAGVKREMRRPMIRGEAVSEGTDQDSLPKEFPMWDLRSEAVRSYIGSGLPLQSRRGKVNLPGLPSPPPRQFPTSSVNMRIVMEAARAAIQKARQEGPLTKAQEMEYLIEAGRLAKGKVKNRDVALYFDGINTVKRDLNNRKDRHAIIRAIVDEVRHHIATADESGIGWYDADIQSVIDHAGRVVPILRNPRTAGHWQRLMLILMGIHSPGTPAATNAENGLTAFAHYANTGEFPTWNPNTGQAWGRYGENTQSHMLGELLKHPQFNRPGQNEHPVTKLVEWMMEPHTVREIKAMGKSVGYQVGVGGLPINRVVPGAYIFGGKVGPFILNLMGIDQATVDVWAARSVYRHAGMLYNPQLDDMQAGPLAQDRRIMQDDILGPVARILGLDMKQVQSVLWFYEKALYEDKGVPTRQEKFSDGAKKFADTYEGRTRANTRAGAQSATVRNLRGAAITHGITNEISAARAAIRQAKAARQARLGLRFLRSARGAPTPVNPISPQQMQQTIDRLRYSKVRDMFAKGLGYATKYIGDTEGTMAKSIVNFAIDQFSDSTLSLGELIDHVRDNNGSIPDAFDAYLKMQMWSSKATHYLNQMHDSFYKPVYDRVKLLKFSDADLEHLKSLSPRLYSVVKSSSDKRIGIVSALLYARHAPERNKLIAQINPQYFNLTDKPGSGITTADADAVVRWLEGHSQWGNLSDIEGRVREIVQKTTDIRREFGLIPEDMPTNEQFIAAGLPNGYMHYVPLRGIIDEDPDDNPQQGPQTAETEDLSYGKDTGLNRLRTGLGMKLKGREDMAHTGRETIAGHVLEHVILQNEVSIARGHKNQVGNAVYKLVEANKDLLKPFAEIVHRGPVVPRIGSDGTVKWGGDGRYKDDQRYFVTKIGGVEHVLEIKSPRLAKTLNGSTGFGDENVQKIVDFIAGFTRFMSRMATGLNPEFWLRNAPRDLMAANINIQQYEIEGLAGELTGNWASCLATVNRANRFGWNYLKTGEESVYKPQTPQDIQYMEFLEQGGFTGYMGLHDFETRIADINKHITKGEGSTVQEGLAMIQRVAGFVEGYNNVLENATRFAVYSTLRNRGLSPERAAQAAKTVTTNFNSGGYWKGFMNSMYMFFNASLAGTMGILTAGVRSKKVQKIMGGIILAGIMQDLLMATISGTDDDGEKKYDHVPEYELEHFLIFPDILGMTKAGYMKIPMPYGFNAIFNFGRVMSKYARHQTSGGSFTMEKAIDSAVGTLVDAVNPLGASNSFLSAVAPTILDPIVDLTANKDFANRMIVKRPSDLGVALPSSQLYLNSTSPMFVNAAGTLNSLTGGTDVLPGYLDFSPDAMQYLFQYFLSGTGAFVRRTADFTVAGLTGDFENLTVGEVPFVRALYGGSDERNTTARFIEIRDEVLRIGLEARDAAQKGDRERLAAVRENYAKELSVYGQVKAANAQRTHLVQLIAKIRNNDKLPDEVKQKRLEELHQREQAVQANAIKAYNRIVEGLQVTP